MQISDPNLRSHAVSFWNIYIIGQILRTGNKISADLIERLSLLISCVVHEIKAVAVLIIELFAVIQCMGQGLLHVRSGQVCFGNNAAAAVCGVFSALKIHLCIIIHQFKPVVRSALADGNMDLAGAAEKIAFARFSQTACGACMRLLCLLCDEPPAADKHSTGCCRDNARCHTLPDWLLRGGSGAVLPDLCLRMFRFSDSAPAPVFISDRCGRIRFLLLRVTVYSVLFDGKFSFRDVFLRNTVHCIEKISRFHKNPSCSR